MTSCLELRLTGANARFGEVFASDLAHLLTGVERAVGRSAAQVAGREPTKAGRFPKSIAEATKLRLTAINEGSVVLELAIRDESVDQALVLDDTRLAAVAIRKVMDVVNGSENGFLATTTALSELAEKLDIGQRYESLAFSQSENSPRHAVLDATARGRLAEAARRRTRSDESQSLVGVLYEADFEKNTARLRSPIGDSVTVRFGDSQAPSVKEALREQARLQGSVTYDDASAAVISVELTEIVPVEQLALLADVGDFWVSRSLEDLADVQGVGVVDRIDDLRDETISEEEANAFLAALGL